MGVSYTQMLKTACQRVLRARDFGLKEADCNVVHLLRGGLNFGLREALAEAYSWNLHSSTFLSAQRRRTLKDSEKWEISESEYRKVVIPKRVRFVLGDVVASGASLKYGLETLLGLVAEHEAQLDSVLFFTIGGPRTQEVFHEMEAQFRAVSPDFEGFQIVYLEGRFPVAERETSLQSSTLGPIFSAGEKP